MTQEHLVLFTPSGKTWTFETGTPIFTAARQLGVDLDSSAEVVEFVPNARSRRDMVNFQTR